MNCPKCGAAAIQDLAFCGTCGANLKSAALSQNAPPQLQSAPAYQPGSNYGAATAPAMSTPPQGYAQPGAPGPYGQPQVPHYGQPYPPAYTQAPAPVPYADFMSRFFALLVDEIIAVAVASFAWGIFFVLSLLVGAVSGGGSGAMVAGFVSFFLGGTMGLIAYITYFVKLETGPSQATFGKRMLGIKICNSQGGRISVGQSLGRLIVKNSFSALFFMIGFLMAAFTEKKQALHDFVASTFVVKA